MNILATNKGRSLMVFAFYFAEGIPIGFIWWAMPTLMRESGAAVDEIGTITAILTLPWVFKFLWAPLVDIFRTARFGFKKWIAVSQSLMCLSLTPLLFIPLANNYVTWAVCLLLHSLFAATQDVSVDALVINVVSKFEKGKINGLMQAGMLTGRSLFGGAVLIFVGQMGLPLTIGLMIFAILCTMTLLFFIHEPSTHYTEKIPVNKFKTTLLQMLKKSQTWYCILFAFTAASAFEAAGAFAGPLFTDMHISRKSIGFFFSVPVVACMLAGGIIGGFWADRVSRKKAVGIYLTGFAAAIIAISIVGFINTDIPGYVWMSLYSVMYFFTGMFTAASYALFMDKTNPKLGATQFSTYMAATNGCEAWVVYSTGFIAATYDYNTAFLIMCAVSLASLLFLRKM